MKTCCIVWGVLAAWFAGHGVAQNGSRRPEAPRVARSAPLAQGFVPNLGQWPDRAAFRAKLGGTVAFLERSGWTLVGIAADGQPATGEPTGAPVRAVALRMSFGDDAGPGPRGEAPTETRQHYFLGNDPTKWCRDVPSYGSVLYERARPGIDVRLYQRDGNFAFDVLVAPDASAADFCMHVDGIQRLRLQDGRLVLETELGPVHLTPPVAWEEDGARREPVASRFVLRDERSFGFEVGARVPGRRLVIDPGIVWSNSLGGASTEVGQCCAVDASGTVCIGGWTSSLTFPVTPGVFDTTFGDLEGFVSKLAPDGSVPFTTLIGGLVPRIPPPNGVSAHDEVTGLAIDPQGRIFVTGNADSTDFPTTPGAFRTATLPGGRNVFAACIAANGATLDYSTIVWVGASTALALDDQGQAILVGYTTNPFWPVTAGAIDSTFSGSWWDGFVTRVGPTGAWLSYSTYFGGNGMDEPRSVAIDAQGRLVVAGSSTSTDLPTTPSAFDPTYNAGPEVWDAFVLRLAPNLSAIDYCTYLGGPANDLAWAAGVDVDGEVVVTGGTYSTTFPTTPLAYDRVFGPPVGQEHVYVTRFSANGSSLVGSTFLGAGIARGCAVDSRGDVTIVGVANTGFPVTPGVANPVLAGGLDPFLTRLRGDLTGLVYSTYLPGSAVSFFDQATAVAIGPTGLAIATGANNDVFVFASDMLPTGATAFGAASPGCNGRQVLGVDSMPSLGNSGFTIILGNALPGALGVMAFTGSGLSVPVPLSGIDVWVDLASEIMIPMLTADGRGRVDVDLPIPGTPSLVSIELFVQCAWIEPTGPAPCPSFGTSASNALQIVLQP